MKILITGHQGFHRIKNLKRYEKLGIGICVDEGSKEWFYNYNKNHNSNFKPKKFIKLGYVADGYDKNKHIWIEYDTPYHILIFYILFLILLLFYVFYIIV